jgi:hypothetical protein
MLEHAARQLRRAQKLRGWGLAGASTIEVSDKPLLSERSVLPAGKRLLVACRFLDVIDDEVLSEALTAG